VETTTATIYFQAAESRARLRKIILSVIERLEYQTGFGPGAQAEKLADEVISALKVEGVRLGELAGLELELAAADPADVADAETTGVRLAPDFAIAGASLPEVLAQFDVTAPRLHAQLATELLAQARRGGAAGDVVSYLQLIANSDLVEGVFTVTWPENHGLPAPGSIAELDAQFPEPVRGTVQVVGFGRVEGTLRVRPLPKEALDELGPRDLATEPQTQDTDTKDES
jgi:hypothetical protein